ncbi:MAG: AAA family ATPase [Tissierellia bacterium]|nr:AAA family ATPase [Tissierellia bacterium]
MKYIKKVILENFQSHKYTVLEFNEQLNVIVGPSDSGKTAILRGIRWVLYNEPSGDYFIREGESHCSVTLEFNDGTKVKRFRSRSKNIYYLYNLENDEIAFEGFGTSVPEEILNATGIKKILLDKDLSKPINLSDQLEGAFLLSEKGSTRASSIGRLVGVNIIDDTIRDTLKDIRNLSVKKKNIEERLLKLQDELSQYEYLEELKNRIEKINYIRDKISTKKKLLTTYRNFNEKLQHLYKEKEEASYYLQRLDNINLLLDLKNDISSNISKFNYLITKRNQIHKLSHDKKYNMNIINSLKELSKVEKNTNSISSLLNLNTQLLKYKSAFNKINKEISEYSLAKDKLEGISYVENNIDTMLIAIERMQKLNGLKDREYAIRKSIAIGENYIERFKNVDEVKVIKDNLEKKLILLNRLNTLLNSFTSINKEIESSKQLIKQYKNTIEIKVEEYKDLLLKQEVCPLCFSNIDDSKIEHIISHYI